ncbi:AAA family ATPase [Streptomyces anulatus]|uniref:AAA family ATPase n=1 Tax=Streptomyces anulatus TaxID=1892 RepID=UPI00364D90BB
MLIERVRSCEEVRIPLRPEVTVFVGENNAGKTTVVDALRLLSDPLDGRRSRYFEESDILKAPPHLGGPALQLEVSGISPEQSGSYLEALVPAESSEGRIARWQVSYASPQGNGRRGSTAWVQRAGHPMTGEPPAHGGVRHMYLLALRDAERELASAGADRVRLILRGLLSDKEQVEAFVERIGTELKKVSTDESIAAVSKQINGPLEELTAGTHPQHSELTPADPTFESIAQPL